MRPMIFSHSSIPLKLMTQDTDVALIPLEIQGLVDRLSALFGPDRKVLSCHGYTNHVAELLRLGAVTYLSPNGKEVHRLSPVTDSTVLNRLFARMQCWLKLVFEVLKAEWPHYGLFASFGIFGLSKDSVSGRRSRQVQAHDASSFQRLAKAFSVSDAGLKDELERLRVTAARLALTSSPVILRKLVMCPGP